MSKQTDLLNLTDAITVDSSNKVGIGTSSPTAALDVRRGDTDGAIAEFHQSTGYGFELSSSESIATITAGYNQAFTFETGTTATERMRIDSSGNLLVGTTSVFDGAYTLQVQVTGSTGGIIIEPQANNYTAMRFNNSSGTQVGDIVGGASSTSYNTSSDHRLKENVTDVTDGITRVKQLAPKRFNFIADADTTVDGFLAHEAQTVVPEAVTGTKDAVDDDGNPVYQGIDQSKLVPLLTAALQEALTKIDALEARLTALEAV